MKYAYAHSILLYSEGLFLSIGLMFYTNVQGPYWILLALPEYCALHSRFHDLIDVGHKLLIFNFSVVILLFILEDNSGFMQLGSHERATP